MLENRDLLRRARRFEEEALTEIYDLYSAELYRYAMRLLGDAQRAEDCVAETFTRFLRALQRGGGPRKHLRAYLYRVAHNWISDHYSRGTFGTVPTDSQTLIDEGPDPSEIVHSQMESNRVRLALAQLTPEQRQVIVLKFIEGWNNREVAVALEKPVGAVKSLQHRGLAALRRWLTHREKIR
jgi:RNA polymerase sigma-70 factor (ECF subfamily)